MRRRYSPGARFHARIQDPARRAQRALRIAGALGDFPLQVRTNFYLAQAYHDLGDYRQAVAYLQQTLTALQGEPPSQFSGLADRSVTVRTFLVLCLSELGAFADAVACGN